LNFLVLFITLQSSLDKRSTLHTFQLGRGLHCRYID